MREAPENLDYGMVNKDHKFDHPDVLESHLEKGKYDSARSGEHGSNYDSAANMRMNGKGSVDPMYGDNHKNKG